MANELIATCFVVGFGYVAYKTVKNDLAEKNAHRAEIEKTRRTETVDGVTYNVTTVNKTIIRNKKTGREAVICGRGREQELGKPRYVCIQYINKRKNTAAGMYYWVSLNKWDIVRTERVNEFKR